MSHGVALAIRGVAAVTAVVLLADAIVSLWSGLYLNLGTGVWLGLARDVRDGVLYRPIWNGAEYGGTRYFPMLFVPIGGLMRLGVPGVPAGLIVSLGGVMALCASVMRLLDRWLVPRPLAVLGGALAVAPYFVHETGFAVRCEPLAAAFALSGLAVLGPPGTPDTSTRRLLAAAALFTGGFATKITCVYAPAAAVVALLIAGRRAAAEKLALFTMTGAVLFFLAIQVLSHGRALESFRACALAGSDAASLLSIVAVTRPLRLIGASHLLTVVFTLAGIALVASSRLWRELPGLYLLAACAVTGVIFTSPGTIITSQIVDVYAAAIILLTMATSRGQPPVRVVAATLLLGLGLWAAAQNGVRIARIATQNVPTAAANRRQLVDAVESCHGSLVSESALIPILAGQRPALLDPFAFHVVGLNRPEVVQDLAGRIERREFACVVLEQDPTTDRGRAWYQNVNLTDAVARAVLTSYTLDRVIAGERIYRPTP